MRQVVSRIKKRDGTVVDFVQYKITKAVYKAMESHDIVDEQAAKSVSDIVTFMMEDKFGGYTIPSVEQIQDIVEIKTGNGEPKKILVGTDALGDDAPQRCIVRLEIPWNKGDETSSSILQRTDLLQVLQSVHQAFTMAEHHRRRRW